MNCGNCGNDRAYKVRSSEQGWEYCDRCGDYGSVKFPDVYWDGKEEHGLADDPETGKPRVFGSKLEKAAYLKANNLVEAGDRRHGSYATGSSISYTKDAGISAQEALATVKKMGKEYRKEAFLRIWHKHF